MQVVHPNPTSENPSLSRYGESPAASRYSVTTREPGASEVFTQGLVSRPASTAFFASSPAAIIPGGFEVVVKLVIAAITAEPWRTAPWFSWTGSSDPGSTASSGCTATSGFPPSPRSRPTSEGSGSGSSRLRNAPTNEVHTFPSGTRSCGRLGPATEGSTADRSSSTTSLKLGSGEPSVRYRPCSLAYRSTRSTRSPRPVVDRYRSVSSSTGQ